MPPIKSWLDCVVVAVVMVTLPILIALANRKK